MKIDIKNLPTSIEELHEIIVFQQAEMTSYKEKYARLIEEIKNQMEDDETEVNSYARRKHPVRKKLPAYIPREVVLHDIPEEEKFCMCGEHLICVGKEVSEQLKYIPAKVSVTQHVRLKYACKPCQGIVKIASMPKVTVTQKYCHTGIGRLYADIKIL